VASKKEKSGVKKKRKKWIYGGEGVGVGDGDVET